MNIPGLLVCQEGCLAFIYSGGFIRCESQLNGPDQSMTTRIQWSPITRPFSPFRLLIDNTDTWSPGTPFAKSVRCSLRDFPYTLSAHKGLSQADCICWGMELLPVTCPWRRAGRGTTQRIRGGLRWLKRCHTSRFGASHFLEMLSLCSHPLISIVLSSLDHRSCCY